MKVPERLLRMPSISVTFEILMPDPSAVFTVPRRLVNAEGHATFLSFPSFESEFKFEFKTFYYILSVFRGSRSSDGRVPPPWKNHRHRAAWYSNRVDWRLMNTDDDVLVLEVSLFFRFQHFSSSFAYFSVSCGPNFVIFG